MVEWGTYLPQFLFTSKFNPRYMFVSKIRSKILGVSFSVLPPSFCGKVLDAWHKFMSLKILIPVNLIKREDQVLVGLGLSSDHTNLMMPEEPLDRKTLSL